MKRRELHLEFTFEEYVKTLDAAGSTGFWAETRRCKAAGTLPQVGDLARVTREMIKTLSARTRFSAADLEAGYRLLCLTAAIPPAWPHRTYP